MSDFFPPDEWSVAETAAWCLPQWGAAATPRPRWIPSEFSLYHLDRFSAAHSRILFTYGGRDPWATQGVGMANLSAGLPVVTAADGSHCADMAAPSAHDTPTMLKARSKAFSIVESWLAGLDARVQRLMQAE